MSALVGANAAQVKLYIIAPDLVELYGRIVLLAAVLAVDNFNFFLGVFKALEGVGVQ